jgi:pectate lyase
MFAGHIRFFGRSTINSIVRVIFSLIILFTLTFLNPVFAQTTIPAFPGAEGFGAETIGGRGGKVYIVSNLNDSGTGSLRECVSATGARTCVFSVGGTITLTQTLSINNPYITIVGQTSPGGGILLRANNDIENLIHITTHDVVIRYLTLRRGPPTSVKDVNGLAIYEGDSTDVYNIVIDHCSMSWTNDRILWSWYGPRNFTIQWSLFTEPLHCNKNTKTTLSCDYSAKSVMLGSGVNGEGSTSPGAKEITFHHNLITHGDERNPLVKPAGIADIISNVTYNTSATYAHLDGDLQVADFPVNFIGNYYRAGPSGSSEYGVKMSLTGKKAILYFEGNIDPYRHNSTQAESLVMNTKKSTYFTIVTTKNPSNPVYPVSVSTCNSEPATGGTCETYNKVVVEGLAGNNRGLDGNGNLYIRRDAVDKRILEEVKTKQGKVIDAPGSKTCWSEAPESCKSLILEDYTKFGIPASEIDTSETWFKGWPIIANGTAYADSDKDGMADTWETTWGFDKTNSADGILDADSDGYTNIEEFLNGTSPKNTQPTGGTPISPTPSHNPADLDNSGKVDLTDYNILKSNYGNTDCANVANIVDKTNPCRVDMADYTILLTNYGK